MNKSSILSNPLFTINHQIWAQAIRVCSLAFIALLPFVLEAQSSNVAKGKTAKQSSDESGGAAARAIDGTTNGVWSGGSITHTANENNPWWEVDLGGVCDISEIKIWNRTDDCCWSRLQNFYVMVSEAPISVNSTTSKQYVPGPQSFSSATESNKSLKNNVAGRYVRIFISGDNKVLSLAEVEVMGTRRPVGDALYFNGTNQHAEFTAPAGMPSGSAPRTVEFWMRSGLRVGAADNHESIVELGEQAHNGSAFGIYSQVAGGKTQLGFWGHNADKLNIGEIPDDQWHFVAITYTEPNIKCYIDGELKSTNSIVTAVGGLRLNTKAGKCYIGGFPARNWYYKGAVNNLSIWSGERTAEQIKKDMIPYPCMQGSETGLVAHFRLNETTGTTFKSLNNAVTGTLKNGATWTKPVADDPDPVSEGVWFLIQNKSDVDADTNIAVRRMALKAPATGTPTLAQIPLTGNYDDFLWRTISLGGGKYKLVNKKLGMAKALDCTQTNPTIGAYGSSLGQSWVLSQTDVAKMGTNVYTMTNGLITSTKALAFASNQVVVAAGNKSDTKQAWVFQPMCLVEGYHIPSTDNADCPTTKQLSAGAIKIYGTNTASDWAMLNTQLIIKNMVNALEVSTAGLNNQRIYIITRYDYDPDLISQYPLVGIPSAWIGDTRGGQHGTPHNLTMVTEEMMCRVGVYSRRNNTPPDMGYREFDQVVHEFGHTIAWACQQNGDATPVCCFNDEPGENDPTAPGECYAASVQAWFNNNFSYGEPCQRTRRSLKGKRVALYNYIDRAFKAENTWMPPRTLREAYDVTKR